ncbi:MAG: MBL fold metallo-hydrolase [Deltaproteobacteria bacterium]|nr:MBL fold metallo-hydrolase [Deltaproteobacteria bacterium]MBW1930463.1 MBL fold metallo-hydrolase [Deltaproteobacteria bacterium]MBW2026912.1 MBL fold metallo-hydrolase [Deltaproteobacteria bacterium]
MASVRIHPLWWPLLAVASPLVVPFCWRRNRRFKRDRIRASVVNQERLRQAVQLDLPTLDFLELTVLVEWKTKAGYLGDPGVSYLFSTDRGTLLFDVGFGPERPTLRHNAAKLGITLNEIDALAISHLHPDHMGGIKASRSKQILLPAELGSPENKLCFLPEAAAAPGFDVNLVKGSTLLPAGLATTGPLARSLFFFGWTEEQALVAKIKDKGLAVFTGCGHPTIELILEMVKRISNDPIYAIGGGLHFPITGGRRRYAGIEVQMLAGTGKPPWHRITDEDLSQTIGALNRVRPKRVLLSAHDTCDHALDRFKAELDAEVDVLLAGEIYRL